MSIVIDLASRRQTPMTAMCISHPAGVNLPLDGPSDAALITPEIRSEINSGAYSADLVRLLPETVQRRDRVLVIGAGLGTVSSLIANSAGVERVIAVEANPEVASYLERVHALNGVPWVETVNAVLCFAKKAFYVPFYARHDIRTSSLLSDECSWQRAILVPGMDLNLILAEEQINLIVCEIPSAAAELLEAADLSAVERVLVSSDDFTDSREAGEIRELLAARGFDIAERGTALMFGRADARSDYLAEAKCRA